MKESQTEKLTESNKSIKKTQQKKTTKSLGITTADIKQLEMLYQKTILCIYSAGRIPRDGTDSG